MVKRIKMKYLFWIIAPCLLIFGAFALRQNSTDDHTTVVENDSLPTRRQLRRSYFQKREILVVYGAEDKKLTKKYKTLLESLSKTPQDDSWRSVAVQFKEASQTTDIDIKNNIIYLVGTLKGNTILKRLTGNIPFQLNPGKIQFNQKEYTSDDTVLSISSYPNKENDTLPISILTGIEESNIYDFFENMVKEGGRSFFRQNMDYEIYQNTTRIVLGDFSADWKLDKSTFFDFSSENDLIYSTAHFDFIDHQNTLTSEAVLSLAAKIEETTNAIFDFFGKAKELPKMTYHSYKSAEEKGLLTGNTAQAHFYSNDNSVHTVINEKYKDNFIEKENALVLHHLIGASKTQALQLGLPVYFTDRWQKKGYRYWSAHLYKSGNALTLTELLDNEMVAIESSLLVDCLSASLVDFLLETWGKDTFLKNYSDWIPSQKEIINLEPLWQAYLKSHAAKTDFQKKEIANLPYMKGFNFAHEGHGIYNGYISKKATESIKKQNEMGSNALALVPYTFMRDSKKPEPFRFSDSANDENDESLVHAAYEAKKLGMFSMLKPQVWVGGGSWPGDIEMSNETDWKKFFDYYYRWIRHYAFLAEIHQMDALSLGVEFTKATLGHGNEWRKMIQKTRGLFNGKITYAANWGSEFENIEFWDEVDFIGLNCYYPLSKNDNPSEKEMKAKFEVIKTKIKTVYHTFKKPIVFTEIGFRSIHMPWKNPHAEGDDSFNEEHQKRCYEIVFEGIENEPWCQGILWWKFPSFLEYRGRENSAFTPNNKMAEETIRKWFLK
jgi:hypothetical protein